MSYSSALLIPIENLKYTTSLSFGVLRSGYCVTASILYHMWWKINDLKIIGISSQSCSRENRSLGCTCPFKTCSSIKGKIIGTIAQSWRRFPNFHTWNRFLIPKNRKTLGQTTILPSEDSYTSLTYPRKNHWNQWNQLGDLLRFCFAPGQKSI